MAENYFGLTDKGRVRDNNEDNFIAQPIMKGGMLAACVIDGVGGYEGGEIAAAIAKESILKSLQSLKHDIFQSLRDALISANKNIYTEKTETSSNHEMACVVTLVLVDVSKNRFYYAHVGDTRLYLFRDNSLVKITRDQSFVGFLEDSGRLTEEEAMNHPKRNEINKALGFDNQIEIQPDYADTGESPFLPGDLLLLCSDGLSDMISSSRMISILNGSESLKEKAESLVNAANEAGGKDNITVVLVKNEKKPLKQKATRPVLVKKKDLEQEPAELIKEPVKNDPPKIIRLKNKNPFKGLIIPFVILLLLSLATSVWLFREHFGKSDEEVKRPPVNRNKAELRLQDYINNASSDTLYLGSVFGDSILLTDSIYINRPFLYLKGPAEFFRDSNYLKGGPAIVIGPKCKQVMLDSLSFNGFELAILSYDPAILQMKDLSYKNTRLSIAYMVKQVESPVMQMDSVIKREN